MQQLKDFITFLKTPKVIVKDNFRVWNVCKTIVYWFLIYYGFSIVLALIQGFMKMKGLFPEHSNYHKEFSLTFYIIFIVPICEELLFRVVLKYSKINLSLFISTIIFFFLRKVVQLNIIYSIIISTLVLSSVFSILYKPNLNGRLESLWKNNTVKLFYISSITFGLVHLTNFVGFKPIHLLFIPIIIGNQLVLGLVFGFLRLKYTNGIIITSLLHILINLPVLLISHH